MRTPPEIINSVYPVTGVKIYKDAIVLIRTCQLQGDYLNHVRQRGKIEKLSPRSLSRLVLRVLCNKEKFKSLLTLTYGQNFPQTGKRVKRDLNQFIVYLKRAFYEVSYFWFLEFQARGAPHVHLGLSLETGVCERELVAEIWSKIAEPGDWPYTAIDYPYKRDTARIGMNSRDSVYRQHRRERVWENARKPGGLARYCIKYATKIEQKYVPPTFRDVGRFWGTSRDIIVPDVAEITTNDREIRSALERGGRNLSNFDVLPKIVYLNGDLSITID